MRNQARCGEYVCANCLEDEALQQFAHEHGKTRPCDYCGKTPTTLSVVSVDDVTDFMGKAIANEWCDPAETSPVDGGEYVVATIDNYELFDRIGFELANERLMDAFR